MSEAATRQVIESFLIHQLGQLLELPSSELVADKLNDKLRSDLDSMMFIRLVVSIEQHFDIAFKDEEILLANFNTIDLIRQKIEHALR